MSKKENLIKNLLFYFIAALQESDGNFPIALNSEKKRNVHKRLVHWCHGAPGAIYLLGKSYLIFKEKRYLIACRQAADLIWRQGLLQKGPGICHGVAGNAYSLLILYRLTSERQFLYRAMKFMSFLTSEEFTSSSIPDRPSSLYEGTAGTVCFLLDLLQPDKAAFPFMDIFN